MSFTIKPFEQIIAEGATAAAIAIGSATPAIKYAKAQAALQAASVFGSLAAGDIVGAASTLQALLASKVLDPGTAKLLSDLFTMGNTFLQADAAALAMFPGQTALAEGIATNIAAGITAVASTYPAPAAS